MKVGFTPRNVQTVEGKKQKVFVITLGWDNSGGVLIPKMPVDVLLGVFLNISIEKFGDSFV